LAAVRYPEDGSLIGLQRDLLRQHDVVNRKIALRREAQSRNIGATLIEFLDVHLRIAVDAITLPSIRTHNLETPCPLVLHKLRGRKPSPKQGVRSLFSFPPPSDWVHPIVAQKKIREMILEKKSQQ
jgi:hypothetical protein